MSCFAGGLLTLLAGCSPPGSSEAPLELPGTRGRQDRATAATSSGLKPLPSPEQVIRAVPLGRTDPFANVFPSSAPASLPSVNGAATPAPVGAAGSEPVAAAVAGSSGPLPQPVPPRPLRLPQGFHFSGVIQTAGRREAVVQYRDLGGSLRAGDRGGISTDLLPRGWSVAAIDVQRGELTLQSDGRRITVQL